MKQLVVSSSVKIPVKVVRMIAANRRIQEEVDRPTKPAFTGGTWHKKRADRGPPKGRLSLRFPVSPSHALFGYSVAIVRAGVSDMY